MIRARPYQTVLMVTGIMSLMLAIMVILVNGQWATAILIFGLILVGIINLWAGFLIKKEAE